MNGGRPPSAMAILHDRRGAVGCNTGDAATPFMAASPAAVCRPSLPGRKMAQARAAIRFLPPPELRPAVLAPCGVEGDDPLLNTRSWTPLPRRPLAASTASR